LRTIMMLGAIAVSMGASAVVGAQASSAGGQSAGTPSAAVPLGAVKKIAAAITWLGQSALRIDTGAGILYVDPYKLPSGHAEKADIILITHSHGDHFSPGDIAKLLKPETVLAAPFPVNIKGLQNFIHIKPGASAEAGGLRVEAVPAYNVVKANFHPKASGFVGYVFAAAGVRIYVAGDTERIPEMKDIRCDIAILPMGQTYTMSGPEEAALAALDTGARIAIPYHYGTGEGKDKDAEDFQKALEGKIEVVLMKRGG